MHNPKVTTDQTVDTSSLDAIVASVVRPSMTDEEKALSLYHFFTRAMYHYAWPYMVSEREENWQDPVKVINVHGYSLCGSQARVFGRLLSRVFGDENVRLIGLTEAARGAWELDKSPGAFIDSVLLRGFGRMRRMGHTSLEVRYGGRWRLLDPHVQFYAYRRDGAGLASAEDCLGDPALVTDPARHVVGLMPCGDLSPVFYASEFVNWGSITREAAPDDHAMEINLRRGETLTQYWDRKGPFVWFSQMDRRWDPDYLAPGPRHICEGSSCWRHYGSGQLLYRPRLTDDSYRDGTTVETGMAPPSAAGIHPARKGRTGRLAFDVKAPYMMAAGKLTFSATRRTGSDRLRLWFRAGSGSWRLIWQDVACGRIQRELDLSPWINGKYGYELRFDLFAARHPQHVALHALTLESTLLLNYLALPRLLPGRNRIRVTVPDPGELRDQRLQVTYAWTDSTGEHQDRRDIATSPCAYSLDVAPVTTSPPENPKYMRFLRLAVT